MADKKYVLEFYQKSDEATTVLFTLTEGSSNGDYGTLVEVSFHKEIYRPGCVEFKIQLVSDNVSNYTGKINLKYKTSVTDTDGKISSSDVIVANSYYIFEQKTETTKFNDETTTYLYCKAYSADKFLTIDKFNYAHTGKRLVDPLTMTRNKKEANGEDAKDEKGNVITEEITIGGIVSSILGIETPAINKFKNLITPQEEKIHYFKNLNHLGTDETEAVIPYCVQYDESFLDFMARICSRHGEFLYCENNEWHIGVEAPPKGEDNGYIIPIITGTSSASKYESCIGDITDKASLLNPNYLNSECKDNKPGDNGVLKKSNGVLAQEYLEPIKEKKYANLNDYTLPTSTAFDLLKSAEEYQNFFDASAATLLNGTMKFGVAGKFMADINDKYKIYYNGLADPGTQNDDDDDDNGIKREFTRSDTTEVNATFYADIKEGKENAEKGKLELEFSTYCHLLLGQTVYYSGACYVVYQINGGVYQKAPNATTDKNGVTTLAKTLTVKNENNTNEIEIVIKNNTTEYQKVTLIPIGCDMTVKTDKETNQITSVSISNAQYHPLPLSQSHIRKASPQRAIVVDNFDPERLGRVRVRYPWQPESENASPWLRVAYPMASKESGFMFFPKEDDEVLIDYEEGDIERPFVNGSFYSATNPPSVPSSTHMVGKVKSITSDNGHHISFTDTSGSKFIAELFPIWGLLSKFGVGTFDGDLVKYLGGGFEIADYLGVYSITGSTHGRNITISSPVGDVKLDAFTGITINAPHGDVKIVGKNVSIEARNNLTMTSGTNIKQPYFWHRDSWREDSGGRLLTGLVIGEQKTLGLDFSLLRTCLEVLLRPIGGTMLIKSHRYMHLEAGEGKTNYVRKVNKELKGNSQSSAQYNQGYIRSGMIARHTFNEALLYSKVTIEQLTADYLIGCDFVLAMYNNVQYIKNAIGFYLQPNNNNKQSVIDILSLESPTLSGRNYEDKWLTDIKNKLTQYYICKEYAESKLSNLDREFVDIIPKNLIETLKSGVTNNNIEDIISVSKLETIKMTLKKNFNTLIKNLIAGCDLKHQIKTSSDKYESTTSTSAISEIIAFKNRNTYWSNLVVKSIDTLGFNGFIDDDVWGKNHKGKILFSDDKEKIYHLKDNEIKVEPKRDNIDTIIAELNTKLNLVKQRVDCLQLDNGIIKFNDNNTTRTN